MLDPNFPLYSPGARRFHDFEEAGERPLLAAEVRRTLEAAAASAAARKAKGLLTRAEADRIAGTWRAIVEDLEQAPRNIASHAGALAEFRVAADGVRWSAKVEALRGEIEARRTAYPGLVAKGQLTHDQAHQQIERLEAVHDLYWRLGFAFDGTRGELRTLSNAILDHDVEQQGAAIVQPAKEIAA